MPKFQSTHAPSAHAANGAALRRQRQATADFRRWMHETMQASSPAGPVLAVGCDQAPLGAQLSEYANDLTVLDTSAVQLHALARRFREVGFLPHRAAQPLPFGRDTFAVVWCCEYLDRVFHPLGALQDIYRVLAPGGRLLLTVPDHGRLRNLLIALFRWNQHFAPANPRIRHFTRATLERLARGVGFADVRTRKTGAVRALLGPIVPRTLLLSARKPFPTVGGLAA